jgi:hypothetical protein
MCESKAIHFRIELVSQFIIKNVLSFAIIDIADRRHAVGNTDRRECIKIRVAVNSTNRISGGSARLVDSCGAVAVCKIDCVAYRKYNARITGCCEWGNGVAIEIRTTRRRATAVGGAIDDHAGTENLICHIKCRRTCIDW